MTTRQKRRNHKFLVNRKKQVLQSLYLHWNDPEPQLILAQVGYFAVMVKLHMAEKKSRRSDYCRRLLAAAKQELNKFDSA